MEATRFGGAVVGGAASAAFAALWFVACGGTEPIVGTPSRPGVGADAADGADGAVTGPLAATPPSCAGLAKTCGKSKDQDCCASTLVPGGTYNRSNDEAYPAKVSAFKMDVFEVTVGRFRAFVNAGKGTQASPPAADDGAHPKIPGSGWSSDFNANLPVDTRVLRAVLECDLDYQPWTDAPGANETLPMSCIEFFDAFAFCAWDGGRLPTEAEWNFAAAGGSEQRTYPWGAGIDSKKASYDCAGDGSAVGACALSDLRPVGSYSPQGDSKWGQADLAGNVWEWVLDSEVIPYPTKICDDCATLDVNALRVRRGGGHGDGAPSLLTATRTGLAPTSRYNDVGARCVRTAAP